MSVNHLNMLCISIGDVCTVQDGIDLHVYPPQPLSTVPSPYKKAKAEDLHKLVSNYVPAEYQEFKRNYPVMKVIVQRTNNYNIFKKCRGM